MLHITCCSITYLLAVAIVLYVYNYDSLKGWARPGSKKFGSPQARQSLDYSSSYLHEI